MSLEVPDGWKESRLGDIIKLEYGKALASGERRIGTIPVFGSSGIVGYHDEAAAAGPSIVLSRKGSLGGVFYVEKGFWPIDTTYFVIQRQNCDWRWLTYLLQFASLERLNEATGVPGLNRDKAAKEPVLVPPLHEQCRIAEILSSVDEAIAATRAVIEQARKVKQGALERVLTKGIGHTRFKQTEFGEIPEGWSLKMIRDFADVKAGATPLRARHDRYFVDGTIPWVKTGDLTDGLIAETEERITPAAVAESSCDVHPTGTVLVAMYGGFQQIGRSGILAQPSATNQAISALRLKDDSILGSFLNFALVGLRARWRSVAASSRKDPNITKDDVLRFNIPVPPVAEQEKIIELMTGLYDTQRVTECEINKLLDCKSALMSDLLTGRKRVLDALPMAAE
ncbi:restriction endonuclease subunit S [Rhizobium sp. SYY.PMSO]|uniref:restriction endonuclease subunit S n=1 Tax=Rhizobium sp. SYY.PMSO TaxID=3382192 RepID=UPI0039901FE2